MDYLKNLALNLVEELDGFTGWEEAVAETASDIAVNLASAVIQAIDVELLKKRGKELRMVGFREKTIVAKFGVLTVKRRLYREKKGKYRFLLDEALGMPGPFSPALEKISILLSTMVTYRAASNIIGMLLPGKARVSHGKLNSLIRDAGTRKAVREEKERRELFEAGVIPESEKKRQAERLFIETDGVWINLQREEKKKGELKHAISHEGWKEKGKAFALVGKTVHLGLEGTSAFWQFFYTKLFSRYELSGETGFIVGADGAAWTKAAGEAFPSHTFELSKFHILKALKFALGYDEGAAAEAYGAAVAGDTETLEAILKEKEEESTGERKKDIRAVASYLLSNREYLSDWRLRHSHKENDRGLGAIEGNNDKIICGRFKKRGMRWTRDGANAMAKVIALRENKELDAFMDRERGDEEKAAVPEELKKSVERKLKEDPQAWLSASMPAFSGSESSKPWVKVLREISRVRVA